MGSNPRGWRRKRKMEITTTPVCRVGSQGQTLHYVIKAQGATQVSVPEKETNGLQFKVTDTRQVPGGVESQLEVKVVGSTLN
jgi:hypothetical protein